VCDGYMNIMVACCGGSVVRPWPADWPLRRCRVGRDCELAPGRIALRKLPPGRCVPPMQDRAFHLRRATTALQVHQIVETGCVCREGRPALSRVADGPAGSPARLSVNHPAPDAPSPPRRWLHRALTRPTGMHDANPSAPGPRRTDKSAAVVAATSPCPVASRPHSLDHRALAALGRVDIRLDACAPRPAARHSAWATTPCRPPCAGRGAPSARCGGRPGCHGPRGGRLTRAATRAGAETRSARMPRAEVPMTVRGTAVAMAGNAGGGISDPATRGRTPRAMACCAGSDQAGITITAPRARNRIRLALPPGCNHRRRLRTTSRPRSPVPKRR
jgi:hypothetical protein